ncbi:MAG TPA: hypothetical protein VN654_05205 [Vicinamibacterales bacterium]|nr:hypothetical protein [Vicinamibacterales bacterium]
MSTQIETTIGALADAEPALERVAAQKLDAKARYHVVKLARLVKAEVQMHFHEPRQDAFKEFGKEREATFAERAKMGPEKVLEVPPEMLVPFRARLKDLCDVPVTLPVGPITPAMVDACAEITALDLLALGPLFEMTEQP